MDEYYIITRQGYSLNYQKVDIKAEPELFKNTLGVYQDGILSQGTWIIHIRAVASGRARGALAPQLLAKQLTLTQLGGQIMPTTVLQAPSDFQILRRPCIYKGRLYMMIISAVQTAIF